MSSTFFDRNQNLQIHGDVKYFLQFSQRGQATTADSRKMERGFEILRDNTAPLARYKFGHSSMGHQCHPGTRIAVQDYIFRWLDDDDGPIGMWMNGPVGIGKSAIAQTVAHLAAEREQLSSAFFFFHSDNTRNSERHLVPTLAYEMTQQIPHTREPVCTAIAFDPHLFSSPLEHQISTTLLQALSTPLESRPSKHRLIIIDGLDECLSTGSQRIIVRSFIAGLLSVSTEIIPHKILIVSRPESHISSAFSALDISCHVQQLALESWDTEDDIGIFLRAKLDEIQQTHPLRHHLPVIWPDQDSFFCLQRRSDGSFAYASIVIRHLESHIHNPEHALKDLLSLQPSWAAVAFADLDALYRYILLSLDEEVLFMLQKILCLRVYLEEIRIETLALLLSEAKSTVEIALFHASSLIQIHDHGRCIEFHHSSFLEFLRDKKRSGDLYIFYPKVASAAATALSRLWLYPTDLYETFQGITASFNDLNGIESETPSMEDMDAHVVNILVTTKLPPSFCYDTPRHVGDSDSHFCPVRHVAYFFQALQRKSERLSEPIRRSLYIQAFMVVCQWLQSHFYRLFHGAPTVKDIIDVLLGDEAKSLSPRLYPFMGVFQNLTEYGDESFYCLRRVFPTVNNLELYSEILDRFLAMLSRHHSQNIHGGSASQPPDPDYFLKMLYNATCNGVRLSGFAQRLEQMVLEGMNALAPVPGMYVTPQQFVGAEKVSDMRERAWKTDYVSLAEKTDQYIRQTHREQDFPYLSTDVEALYRASSPAPRGAGFWC